MYPQSNTERTGLTSLHWTDWIAVCWAGGVLFLLARLIVGIGAVWHLSVHSDTPSTIQFRHVHSRLEAFGQRPSQ